MAVNHLRSALRSLQQSPRRASALRKAARKLLLEQCEPRQLMAVDLGDLPNGYGTLLANNGPQHTITPGVFLGANVDAELDGQPSANASGDNTNGSVLSPPGDEQGVNFDQPLQPGGVSSLEVSANVPGFLHAWIDFNGNGSFADAGEHIAGPGALGFPVVVHGIAAGPTRIPFQVPAGSVVGNTFARFRFTTSNGPLSPTGGLPGNIIPDGEVEDYQLTISTPVDFGDAPDSYGTLLGSNGARHTIAGGLFLGTSVDPEPDAPPRPSLTNPLNNVISDDVDEEGVLPLNLDDEAGVVFSGPIVAGKPMIATVAASAAGKLDAWVDFNRDGDFLDAGEKIASNLSLVAGNNALNVLVPAIAVPGSSWTRFRFSSIGNLGPTGLAADGEVEDHSITILPGTDFGDAPLPYPDASHDIVPGFHLGSSVDPEAVAQIFDTNALGDDQHGGPDDEDGIATDRTLISGSNHAVTVTVANAGYLNAWVDFNANGSWADPGEQIFAGQLLNPGATELTFAVPGALAANKTFARFRFSQTQFVLDNGFDLNGEVEDYELAIGPQDFGDAPDSYRTLAASGGAAHVTLPVNPFIGVTFNTETDGQPAAAADLDDDDGIFHNNAATQPLTANIPLIAGTNTLWVDATLSPVNATLNAWIDFNQNGTFEPAEQIAHDLPLLAGNVNPLPFVVPATATFGDTVARFRVSTEAGLSPQGLARDGEVEDYVVNLAATALDFGDAPDSYSTLLGSNGPRHTLPRQETSILLGGTTNGSFEAGTLTGWTIGGSAGWAEVVQGSNFTPGVTPAHGNSMALISTGANLVNPVSPGDLDGNGSNDFDSSTLTTTLTLTAAQVPAVLSFDWNFLMSESVGQQDDFFQVLLDGTPVLRRSSREALLPLSTFPDTVPTDLISRGLTSTGPANGSIFTEGQTGFSTFQTLITTPGTFVLRFEIADQAGGNGEAGLLIDNVQVVAQPTLPNSLRLGSLVDADPNGQPRGDSLGDDLDADGDDDDGVTFIGDIIPGNPFGDVAVFANIPSGNAFLDAWVDYNRDGDFDDVGEQVVTSAPLAAGINHPAFDAVPATALTGLTHARFRISSSGNLTPRGLAADGEVEDYLILIGNRAQLLDFGDAPFDQTTVATIDDYPTLLAQNGPRHQFDPNNVLFLGANLDLDHETDGTPNATATGDNTNNTNDENGVQFPLTSLVPGSAVALPVVANASGLLNAWIDFNANGSFTDPGEQIATNLVLAAGTNTVNFVVPAIFPPGIGYPTYARFRFGSTPGLTSVGPASEGEVEDYLIGISDLDFGDAPDNSAVATDYATLLSSNGARHVMTTGPRLGTVTDAELDGKPNAAANGDDTLDGSDDEDGITFTTPLIPGDLAGIAVEVANAGGFLDAWLDLNGDGDWADFGERVIAGAPVVVGVNNITFALPFGAKIGPTQMRFRATTAGIASPIGLAPSGEVEDYAVTIQGADFGDAPDSFQTRLPPVGNGARHALMASPTIFLGAKVDSDVDGQADNFALGDDSDEGDDEDGVSFAATLLTGSVADFTINYATATTNAVLNAWIDFNGNGTFDPLEQIATDWPLTAGQTHTLSVPIAANAFIGTSFARFRVSTATGLGPIGPATDGEVEDYQLTIANGIDWGDAPDPDYSTLTGVGADGGPRHLITGLTLGALIDADANGQPHTHSLGDDLNGSDDEDGILFLTPLQPGGVAQIQVTAMVPGGAPVLNGWIDFRGDGDWDDPGEHPAGLTDVAIVNGVNIINFAVPNWATPGLLTHARFRLSTSTYNVDSLGPDGIVPTLPDPTIPDGEVEDYEVILGTVSDRGDAPDGALPLGTPQYPTLNANGGVFHVILPGAFLGQSVDAEADGQPTTLADGDDTLDSDDEDGVIFSQMVPGAGATLTVTAAIPGFINAWVDFNGNGDWNDANEWIAASQPVVVGPNVFNFQVPPNAVVSTTTNPLTYSRVRFSTFAAVLTPAAGAISGEVEDQAVTIGALPTLSINDVSITEQDRNQNVTATFTVSLAVPYSNAVTVNYSSADGTALTSGNDYTGVAGSLTFAPGVTTQTISVTILGDISDEADETFVINLSSPVNATLADGQGTGTIVDNDTSTAAYTLVLRNPAVVGQPEFARGTDGKYRIPAGANFIAEVLVDDLRNIGAAGGVFAGFADLLYSPDLVDWTPGSLTYGSQFTTSQAGTINDGLQLVDEAGGTFNPVPLPTPPGVNPAQLLFRVGGTIKASAPLGSAIDIALDAADAVGTHPTLVFGVNTEVPASYETEQIIVGDTRPWQNPSNPCDVNNDGRVDQLDVVTVVNALLNGGSRTLANPPVAPDLPNPTPNIPGTAMFVDLDGDGNLTQQDAVAISLCPKDPVVLAADALSSNTPLSAGEALDSAQLTPLVAAAIEQWKAAGITPAEQTALEQVQFQVTDLDGAQLGLAQGWVILIDQSAAGLGWFVDLTPESAEEFSAADGFFAALADSPAAGKVDLLSVIAHELGHLLGEDDSTAETSAADLMFYSLGAGQRKLPSSRGVDLFFGAEEP